MLTYDPKSSIPYTIEEETELSLLPTGVKFNSDGVIIGGSTLRTGTLCKLIDGTDYRIFCFKATERKQISDDEDDIRVINGFWYEL